MSRSRRRSLIGNRPKRAQLDLSVYPPRIVDSPDADSAMLDPATQRPLEPEFSEPVSEEPGVMPGVSTEHDYSRPPPRLPQPPKPRPPPAIQSPRPSLDTPRAALPRLQIDPPRGLVFTPMYRMGIGHVAAPEPEPLLQGYEAHLLAGLGAMAVGFILTGAAGLFGLWWSMGDELFQALDVAFTRLFA